MKKSYSFNKLSDVECLSCTRLLKLRNQQSGHIRCFQCWKDREAKHGHVISGQTGLVYVQSKKRLPENILVRQLERK